MSTPSEPPRPEPQPPAGGAHLDSAGDLTVGGDVAGRDVVKNQTTIHTGLSEKTVVRLVIIVGVLVFITAACFFSGGVVIGAAALTALNRPVGSDPAKAVVFEQKLAALNAIAPGQALTFAFSEDEISSYVKYILGPEIGFVAETGKVRLVNDEQVIVSGQLADLGGMEVAATFQLSDLPGEPLALQSAAAHVLDMGDTPFGWVALPTSLLQPAADQINARLGNVQLVGASAINTDPNNVIWELDLQTR
ncbi:MAG: hypothetical protein KA764_14820 [Anaerolineales bacterium]|nr:hypothetical protein [Anaerolineales bacterium]